MKYCTAITLYFFIVTILLLSACQTQRILLKPSPITTIQQETVGGIIHYYCYLNITNDAADMCKFALESQTQHLKLASTSYTQLAAHQTIEAKYEIVQWNAATPCTPPCIVDSIRMKAQWPNDRNDHDEEQAFVQWNTPKVSLNCWARGGNVGDNDNFYQAVPLGIFTTPSVNDQGPTFALDKVGIIHNPNDFDILFFIENNPRGTCLNGVGCNDNTGVYQPIKAHESFDWGNILHTYYSAASNNGCLQLNNAFGYICSPTGQYTKEAEQTKWIALRVDLR